MKSPEQTGRWFEEPLPPGQTINEQSGWLTGSAPTNLRIALTNFIQYWTTRQWTADEGDLTVKLYNLWGQDWNNARPTALQIDLPPDTLSGGLEKIKIAPTY